MSTFHKFLTVLAVLTAACFVALVVLQVLELVHYDAEPSVWVKTP